jgi:hypothetical protein
MVVGDAAKASTSLRWAVLDDHIRQTDGDPIAVYTRICAPEAFVHGYRFAGRLGKRRQQRLRSNVSYHLAQKAIFTNLNHLRHNPWIALEKTTIPQYYRRASV